MKDIIIYVLSLNRGKLLTKRDLRKLLRKYPVIVDDTSDIYAAYLYHHGEDAWRVDRPGNEGAKMQDTVDYIHRKVLSRGKNCFMIYGFRGQLKDLCFNLYYESGTVKNRLKIIIKRIPAAHMIANHTDTRDVRENRLDYANGVIGDLLDIMKILRSDNGCPWDREQDHHSLRQYLIEEAYEVVAAIDEQDFSLLQEELGDLLLQIVFHSQIASERSCFTFADVVASICAKLKRRHPHVFNEKRVIDKSGVKLLWEEIKAAEKSKKSTTPGIEIDQRMPALLKAYKLQRRAADLGFDWPSIDGAIEKAQEELGELIEAYAQNDHRATEEELGDYLFSVVNMSRFLGINPELALGKTVNKFRQRFSYILAQVEQSGKSMDQFSLQELDQWWDQAKKISKISNQGRNPDK